MKSNSPSNSSYSIETTENLKRNTEIKRLGLVKEHISNASIIGIAILLNINMDIKVPLTKKGNDPVTLHHLIVENISIAQDLSSPSLGKTRTEKRSRSNIIYNTLSDWIKQNIIDIVSAMGGDSDCLVFHISQTRSTTQTVKLNVYESFEPFNREGFQLFGKKVIDIITNVLSKVYVDKRHALVRLEGQNQELINAFIDVIIDTNYITTSSSYLYNFLFQPQPDQTTVNVESLNIYPQIQIEENQQETLTDSTTQYYYIHDINGNCYAIPIDYPQIEIQQDSNQLENIPTNVNYQSIQQPYQNCNQINTANNDENNE